MRVLIVGDIHLPFDHANYLKFLRHQKERLNPDKIVFIGDVIDHYALSRFSLDPDVQGQVPEFKAALEKLYKYYELFPEAVWIIGNHDRRPYRKAFEIGLGRTFLKSIKEIYQCPDGWDITEQTDIDGVTFTHEPFLCGQQNCMDSARTVNQSTCAGHLHNQGGYKFHQDINGRQIFSLQAGTGVDDDAYAFAYGKRNPKKSILGCGYIEDGIYPSFIPMDLNDRKYRRIR